MRIRPRLLLISGVLLTCVSSFGAQAPAGAGPTCKFSTGFPKTGAFQGQLNISVEWANCNGVTAVAGYVSKTVNGQPVLAGLGFTISGTAANPLLATGNYSWNYATGEQAGTQITSGTVAAFHGANNMASEAEAFNPTIPVP